MAETIGRIAGDLARTLADETGDLRAALAGLTRAARDTIPGVDNVSISRVVDGTIETLAPTSPVIFEADRLQYELDEGPCLEAVRTNADVDSEDVGNDLRWPVYGPRAVELGIGSQLAMCIHTGDRTAGALNLYSGQTWTISEASRDVAELFATQAAIQLGFARTVEQLNEALSTRRAIGQAIGIVMERFRLDEDRAFAFLVRTSQDGNVKLRDVAQRIVDETNASSRRQGRGARS